MIVKKKKDNKFSMYTTLLYINWLAGHYFRYTKNDSKQKWSITKWYVLFDKAIKEMYSNFSIIIGNLPFYQLK